MSVKLAIRAPTIEDANAIANVYAISFTQTFGSQYPPEELKSFLDERDGAAFGREIEAGEIIFRVAVHPTEGVCGFIKVGPSYLAEHTPNYSSENRSAMDVKQMYLLDIAKGTGVAQELMNWAIDIAKETYDDILLTVWIDNPRARRFYEKFGFVEVSYYV